MLDTAELRGLARLGGNEFVDEVVAMFLETTRPRIAAAEAAAAAGDAGGVRHVVHAMASSACTLGVRRVERLAKTIEAYAIDESWPHIDVLLPELAPALAEAEQAIARAREGGMCEAVPPVAVIAADSLERTLVHAALAERYDLSEHESGESALVALQHTLHGAVVISAAAARGMTAGALVRAIRAVPSLQHLPLVALVSPGEEAAYQAVGVDACVCSSPVDAAQLRAVVDRLLAARPAAAYRPSYASEGCGA